MNELPPPPSAISILLTSVAVIGGIILALALVNAAFGRDRNVPIQFQRTHPCPSTGLPFGSCPGYVRDHIIPLCKGGPDTVANMQWQSLEEGKAKDKVECK